MRIWGARSAHTFDRDTRITFYPDGTYGYQRLGRNAPEQRAVIGNAPLLLIGSRGTELRVSGTLNGNVLVYSPHGITVEGNLFYAHDPRRMPEAPDYLGLASGSVHRGRKARRHRPRRYRDRRGALRTPPLHHHRRNHARPRHPLHTSAASPPAPSPPPSPATPPASSSTRASNTPARRDFR